LLVALDIDDEAIFVRGNGDDGIRRRVLIRLPLADQIALVALQVD
jgi:hypothetical protein